ncbi:MAG: MarR family transcriptional regulator [Rhizobacter sp.]|nr:MarR family transcriptional regulator [Rhizobacter sp.]
MTHAVPAEADPALRVLRRFRIVFNAVKAHFQQVEALAGVSGAQLWALHVVHDRPGLGVSDLARAMDVRQPTASGFVKSLVQQGLVEARREGSDRRAVQLHLTRSGQKVLLRAPGPFSGVLPQALARLDAETLAHLEAALDTLATRLGADGLAAGQPLGEP